MWMLSTTELFWSLLSLLARSVRDVCSDLLSDSSAYPQTSPGQWPACPLHVLLLVCTLDTNP